MDKMEWAKNEIKLACKNEAPDRKDDEWDYGCACYESALKAFESLCQDGHSGFSISLTKNILNRLIDGLPLTPITDEDFLNVISEIGDDPTWLAEAGLRSTTQCPRMGSLFKYEYLDGTIRYTDVDRYICIDLNTNGTYTGGFTSRLIDEMFPITLPYYPATNKLKLYTEDFLVDPSLGDFDTRGILYCITPEGERFQLDRFFKEERISEGSSKTVWKEISKNEYNERKLNANTNRREDA